MALKEEHGRMFCRHLNGDCHRALTCSDKDNVAHLACEFALVNDRASCRMCPVYERCGGAKSLLLWKCWKTGKHRIQPEQPAASAQAVPAKPQPEEPTMKTEPKTEEERRQGKREYRKKYREKNREKIREYSKKWSAKRRAEHADFKKCHEGLPRGRYARFQLLMDGTRYECVPGDGGCDGCAFGVEFGERQICIARNEEDASPACALCEAVKGQWHKVEA